MERIKKIDGKPIELPLKTLSDTFKRQYGSFDKQNLGKPFLDKIQAEEYRTKLKDDHLERLRADQSREEEKEDLASKLESPGEWESEALDIGYIPATKEVREKLGVKDYVHLLDVGEEAGMNVIVVPPFYEKEAKEIKQIIYSMVDYAQNALNVEIKVAPTLDVAHMTPQFIEDVMQYVEGNYTQEELPMISVKGFNPLSSVPFDDVADKTDRVVYVASCKRKIHWRKQDPHRGDDGSAYGKVSAEVLITIMGADIIGRFYNLGSYFGDEEDVPPIEMEEEMFNPLEAIYNDVGLNTVDRVACHGCDL